jgi:hypothetical protein
VAVRYSGDATVRVRYDYRRRLYAGTVSTPFGTWKGEVKPRLFGILGKSAGPKAYDDAARDMLRAAAARAPRLARAYEGTRSAPTIRRVFQAPCPCNALPERSRRRRA